MTELTISSDEIRSAIAGYVSSLETGTSREEVGTVVDTGDGIAHVEGLASAMTNELLEFVIAEARPSTCAMPSPTPATVPTSSRDVPVSREET